MSEQGRKKEGRPGRAGLCNQLSKRCITACRNTCRRQDLLLRRWLSRQEKFPDFVLVIHSYPSHSYRDPQSREDMWIKIPVRYYADAKVLGRQNARRRSADDFRPLSCRGFYLFPSCSRKRTLLFAEHLTNEVLLKLPHRKLVFTMPKTLRPFFRHDRRLFADVSRLIYNILREFYHEAAGRPLLTGIVVVHQTFGDMLR